MEFASFHSNAITALLDFNQLLLDFFNIVDLQLILMLLNDALNLVINADHPWALGAMTQKKVEMLRIMHCRSGTLSHMQCTSVLLAETQNCYLQHV